jgi:hypothetical protein
MKKSNLFLIIGFIIICLTASVETEKYSFYIIAVLISGTLITIGNLILETEK